MSRKRGYIRIFSRHLFVYRKSGPLAMMWLFVEPLLYLFAFGYGLGAFVQNMDGKSFLDFFFPGLIVTTTFLVSFQEATHGQIHRAQTLKLYSTWLLLPLHRSDIFWGEFLWSVTRGTFAAFGVCLAGLLLGLFKGWGIVPAFAGIALIATLGSFIGMYISLRMRRIDDHILIITGAILPLLFISGVLFPTEGLPLLLKIFSHLFPFIHAVELTRSFIDQKVQVIDIYHLSYLVFTIWIVGRMTYRKSLNKALS